MGDPPCEPQRLDEALHQQALIDGAVCDGADEGLHDTLPVPRETTRPTRTSSRFMVEMQSTAEASTLPSLLPTPIADGIAFVGCACPEDRGTFPEKVRRRAAHDKPLPPTVNPRAAHGGRQPRSTLVDEDRHAGAEMQQAQKANNVDG
ncbi:hypothetical protein THAOC_18848 [Thalassiosira oceanica]|uniref:Uncharacterized protein n=1 Tax=Thalassiosira oceanica TaxID=159749 RepID=K0SIB8_THAOC|nr:hypothetical protein THAOC_18848 [Thalassiosira oceanica]|eukprot:EJK60746.1 hypothetical protein THAOC_18848 [Thalassiosira oceanica]